MLQNTKGTSKLGVMLDCSRAAVMSIDELKRFIVYLKDMGYNSLQLYTEDTYEIDEPLFGHLRGRYSKAELKEIDDFAYENGIELVPCIQTLGHLTTLFYWDRLYDYKDNTSILWCGEEKVYDLIEKMFKTCDECFRSRTVNIGMDEAWLLGAGNYYDKHGPTKREDVLLPHLNRVSEMAKKYNFTLVMWSDMFFRMAGYNEYYVKGAVIPEEVRKKVPENVELAYWDYYTEDKDLYDNMLDSHISFDRNVWFAGGAWRWIGFQSGNQKTFDTTLPAIKSCNERNVNDILITLWGDDGSECPVYAALPGIVYAAECAKGNYDLENSKKKFEELFGESWDDFMLFDLKMPADVKLYRENATGAKEMLYSDPFLGKFDGGVYGTGIESKIYAEKTEQMKQAKARSKNYAYMFDYYEKLCRLLSVKYELGYRSRFFYQKGDKAMLKKVVKEYGLAIKYLEEFIEAFRVAWFKINKPQGFEVHEIRLGGVMLRLKSCKKRLELYLKGKVDRIDELEESFENPFVGDVEKAIPMFNCYRQTATLNEI
ncbi:MAG: beta-N-acetylhexosaminidase [Clostridia bacterium]|nr:beta-N-acetylhexosaminidase [Clostridia bacterium]